ncbi:MAG: hypothetical protein GY791_00995 [Alphaproteobacteria bacterium]|nr:hypothetical protein [Alphaproteobacteria bacterium]
MSETTPAPRPGTGFFSVGEAGVVFSEPSQNLYAVDPLAAWCWLEIEAGRATEEIAAELTAAGDGDLDAARRRIAAILESFAAADLLDDGRPPRAPDDPDQTDPEVSLPEGLDALLAAPAETVYLHGMGRVMRLDFSHPELARLYRPMVAPLETAAATTTDRHLAFVIKDRVAYGCDQGEAVYSSATEGTPAAVLERLVWRGALQDAECVLSIHCGSVGVGARDDDGHPAAWLCLPAASGSGKTTLTAALSAAGFPYGSDELIALGADLRARPLSFPLCVKTKSWDVLAPLYPGLGELPVYRRYQHRVRYLPPATPLERPDWRPIAGFVFPRYAADGETALTPLDPVAGLQRLFDQCLTIPEPLDLATVGRLVAFARQVPFYELPLSDLDAAVAAIRGFTDSL